MKVIYKESILSKIAGARLQAIKDKKSIEKIILYKEEWDEFFKIVEFQQIQFIPVKISSNGELLNSNITELKYDDILLVKGDN